MTTRTAAIHADRRTVVDAYGTPPRTVVARAPSDADTTTFLMHISISGSPILRPYDDELELP